MELIKRIRIRRFRSFNEETVEVTGLNIFSGRNNAGKSNILRALNLFFNSRSNYDTPYNHNEDYNMALRGAAGGSRQIQIEITFNPVGKGALRYEFSIQKTFSADSVTPEVEYKSTNSAIQAKIDEHDGTVTRQFTRYLNRIEYLYIPAVRDKRFIKSLLLRFEQIIGSVAKSEEFDEQIGKLSDILKDASTGISNDFEKYIGLPANAALSSSVTDVLGAIEIFVKPGMQVLKKGARSESAKDRLMDVSVNLFSSGDGVVMAYLVYFLAYLTKKDRTKRFIWGFEEPENSLEYSKVQRLSDEFYDVFSKEAQIFITTHSPAFIGLKDRPGVYFYRVYIRPLTTREKESFTPDRKISHVQSLSQIKKQQLSLFGEDNDVYNALDEELHLIEQSAEIERLAKTVELEREKMLGERRRLEKRYSDSLKSNPEKIFVCEDKKMKAFWEKILEKSGIMDVSVISSDGCSGLTLENWITVQARRVGSYNPVVFREVDRDGLSDQILTPLCKAMEGKVDTSNGVKYKYCPLPVNEIENFAILMKRDEFHSDLPDKYKLTLADSFRNTVEARLGSLRALAGSLGKDPKEYSLDTPAINRLRDAAMSDWPKMMPGKDLLKCFGKTKLISVLKKADPNDWPKEMRDYIEEIRQFFNNA